MDQSASRQYSGLSPSTAYAEQEQRPTPVIRSLADNALQDAEAIYVRLLQLLNRLRCPPPSPVQGNSGGMPTEPALDAVLGRTNSRLQDAKELLSEIETII